MVTRADPWRSRGAHAALTTVPALLLLTVSVHGWAGEPEGGVAKPEPASAGPSLLELYRMVFYGARTAGDK